MFVVTLQSRHTEQDDARREWAHQLRGGFNLPMPSRVLSVLRFDVCFNLAQVSTEREGACMISIFFTMHKKSRENMNSQPNANSVYMLATVLCFRSVCMDAKKNLLHYCTPRALNA